MADRLQVEEFVTPVTRDVVERTRDSKPALRKTYRAFATEESLTGAIAKITTRIDGLEAAGEDAQHHRAARGRIRNDLDFLRTAPAPEETQ